MVTVAPRVLVINIFNNDPPKGYTPVETMQNVALLCDFAKADFPDIKIFCMSAAPGPKRNGKVDYFTRARDEFDILLEDYCSHKDYITFVNQRGWDMFYASEEDRANGIIREDIYADDKVHFNQAGYDLYKEYFKQMLDEYL